MNKIVLSLVLTASLVTPFASFAASPETPEVQARINAMLKAVNEGKPEVYLPADHYNTDLAFVMKANGISREEAIERMARSLISVANLAPKPAIPQGYGAAYDPAPHAYRQALSRMFYAGMNLETNQPVFLPEQRTQMGDNFWYCNKGLTYVYTVGSSFCK